MDKKRIRAEYLKLKKDSSLQDACEGLSPKAQKLLLYIIAVMNVTKNTHTYPINQFIYEFDLADYYELVKTKKVSDNNIRQILEELCQTTYWVPLGNDTWQCVGWLKDAMISADGHVKVELHKFVGLALTRLSNPAPNLKKYSNRLYHLLKPCESRDFVRTVDQVRNEMKATSESYKRYSNFKQRVLDVAVREINNCTDIFVTFRKVDTKLTEGKMEVLSFFVEPKLKYLKSSTSQVNIKKRLPPQEVEVPPVQKVHTACKVQSVQETKKQLLPSRQTANMQLSVPGESEEEDLPF